MKKSIITRFPLIAMGLPLLAGCVARVAYTPPPPAGPPPAALVEPAPDQPPPPQVDVTVPRPIWIAGAWEWRGSWVWVHGDWGYPPRPGAIWIRGHWGYRRHRNVWVGGHWQ